MKKICIALLSTAILTTNGLAASSTAPPSGDIVVTVQPRATAEIAVTPPPMHRYTVTCYISSTTQPDLYSGSIDFTVGMELQPGKLSSINSSQVFTINLDEWDADLPVVATWKIGEDSNGTNNDLTSLTCHYDQN